MGMGGSNKSAAIAAQQAAEMKAEEEARQARIKEGQGKIDSAFTKYDDSYYGGYSDAYKNYYNPQIDQQYNETKDALISALAARGTLESTVGAERFAKLAEKYADSKGQIANQAADAVNTLRGKVEKTKTDLYNVNQSAADPAAISTRAAGEATALAAPQAYSDLGQLFTSILQPVAAYASAASNSRGGLFGNGAQPSVASPTNNSAKVTK